MTLSSLIFDERQHEKKRLAAGLVRWHCTCSGGWEVYIHEMNGFKEWDVICRALECGWQSMVLRAGGILDVSKWHEELPERFFLMPNDYHAALNLVQRVPPGAEQPVRKWEIRSWAEVIHVSRIDDAAVFDKLAAHHILKPQVVEKRFHQHDPAALWLILLRVYKLPKPWKLPDAPEFGGCRSLVQLPQPPFPLSGEPVMSDEAFHILKVEMDEILNEGCGRPT